MPAVTVDLILRGIPDLQRGLRSVEQSAVASERSRAAATERAAKQRTRAEEQAARDKIRAMIRADAEAKRIIDRSRRDVESSAKQRARAEERAEREGVRAAEKAANEKLRIARQVDREFAAMQRRRERENERMLKEGRRLEERAHQESLRDEKRKANQSQNDRKTFARGLGQNIVGGVSAGVSRVTGLAGKTAGMVSQLGGGFSIADSVQRTVALKGKLADIASRDTDISDPSKKQRKSTADLEGRVRAVSTEFGFEADTGADALDKFASKTGDLQKGLDMLRGLGQLSRAGAGSMDDLADAAGDIFNADKTQTAEQVLQKLRQFAIQGQKGAVEMKDLASQMAKIGAASGRFEGGADKNLATMGALAQLARESGGAASSSEATTAVSSLSNQFYKNARLEGFKNLGVEVKNKEGFNRNVEDVLFESMLGAEKKSRAGGRGMQDFDKLMGTAIASSEARKATGPLEAAFKKAGGGQAGVDAAKKELAKFGSGGRDLKTEFADKANARMQEEDVKLAKIREDFDKAVSGKLIPILMRLIPEFEKLIPMLVDLAGKGIPAFVDLIKTVTDFAEKNKGLIADIAAHPIGTIMAVEVTKSIGSAAIGEGVKAMLVKLLAGAAPGGGGGGGGGGPGVAAPALGTGLAAAFVTSKAMLGYEGGKEDAQDLAAKLRAWQAGDRSERAVSPEVAELKLKEAASRVAKGNAVEHALDLATSPFVDKSDRDYKQYKADQGLLDNSKDMRELIVALKANTAATKNNTAAPQAPGAAPAAGPEARPPAASTGIVQRTQ